MYIDTASIRFGYGLGIDRGWFRIEISRQKPSCRRIDPRAQCWDVYYAICNWTIWTARLCGWNLVGCYLHHKIKEVYFCGQTQFFPEAIPAYFHTPYRYVH